MSTRSYAPGLASLTLLAAWLGAAVFVSAVITPAAFAVLPTRALAGALVGRALPILFLAGILAGGVVVVMNQRMGATRLATGGAVCFATACAAALMVTFRLRAMLVTLGAPIETLDQADPRRRAFGHLHGASVLLMGLGLIGACLALGMIARQLNARSTA